MTNLTLATSITNTLEAAHISLRELVSAEADKALILLRAKQVILLGDVEDLNFDIDPEEDSLEERAEALVNRIPRT